MSYTSEITEVPAAARESAAPVRKDSTQEKPVQAASENSVQGRPKYQFSAAGYQYSREELNIKYQSKDGDSFELSYQSENIKAFYVEGDTPEKGDTGPYAAFLEKLKNYINQQEQKLLDTILSRDWSVTGTQKSLAAFNQAIEQRSAEVPDYWNAENTSQRIVDFALSFFDPNRDDPGEFGEKVIKAVKQGFEDANKILGNLPGEVGKLIADTQSLTLEKLDSWVASNSREEMAAAA